MTFTHALASNNYGPAKFIVATNAANGTHTTLASAIAAASVGDTIFLRDSVTENVTLTPGVNIAAYISGPLNTPSITGKVTMTGAGTSTIYGITLITNSDFAVSITGSAASILYLINCSLVGSNNTIIQMTTSSASALLTLESCLGNLSTTGIAIFSFNSSGSIRVSDGNYLNSGNSTTANSFAGSGGFFPESVAFANPFSFTGTSVISGQQVAISCSVLNTTAMTFNSTAAAGGTIIYGYFNSGTASALSIGAGATFTSSFTEVQSSNTNAITGSGILNYGLIVYSGTSSGNNVTTQTKLTTQPSSLSGSMVLISTKTASSSASIVFNSGISATYNNYMVILSVVVPATNAVNFNLDLSTDGGSTYLNSGFNGYNTVTGGGSTASTASTTTWTLNTTSVTLSNTANRGYQAQLLLQNMTSGGTPAISGYGGYLINGATGNIIMAMTGTGPNSTTVNAIKFSMSSGNISTGTFSLYGIVS